MAKRIIGIQEKLPLTQGVPLALQHVFAMFGATVLVPYLTGLNPSTALLTSGLGTLIFHLFTKGLVPAYLGSSFAFIAGLTYWVKAGNVPAAMGGAAAAGMVYLVVYLVIKLFGPEFINRYVPPVVVGPVVMIIGLSLANTAVSQMASTNWPVAVFALAVAVFFSVFGRGFWGVIPILLGILAGYLLALLLTVAGVANLVDFSKIAAAPWVSLPVGKGGYHVPTFNAAAVLTLAPVAFVTIIEDLGHVFVIGNVTGQNMIEKPGFHRVLLGNGLATIVAAFLGGPPSTTYGENIGVLAITGVYSAWVIRIAALVAILLSLLGKVGAAIAAIPVSVMGGISILLFGMIAAAGMRTLVDARLDLSQSRNLIIVSIILVLGIGLPERGVALATLAGIVLNLILPRGK